MDQIKKEPMGLAVACKRFFGFKEGQNITSFAAEVNALSPTEKQEFAVMLSDELGCDVIVK
jgi:hypothetical protein